MLDIYLPPRLRGPSSEAASSLGSDVPTLTVSAFLSQARRVANIDLLTHLGVKQNRWDAVLWLVQQLLEETLRLRAPITSQSEPSSKKLPRSRGFRLKDSRRKGSSSLDQLTQSSANLVDFHKSYFALTSPIDSLKALHGDGDNPLMDGAVETPSAGIGLVLRSLGRLILTASKEIPSNSTPITSHIFHILVYLRRCGCFMSKKGGSQTTASTANLGKVPVLETVMADYVTLLEGAFYSSDIAHGLRQSRTVSPQMPQKHNLESLRTVPLGVHFEMLLWACVSDERYAEGAAIVQEARKFKNWSLFSWKDVTRDVTSQTNESIAQSYLQSRSDPAAKTSHHFSAEVVEALVDGLLASTSRNSVSSTGYSLGEISDRLGTLKGTLDREKKGLQTDSWNSLIARFAQAPEMNIENNAKVMEKVLEMAETYNRGHDVATTMAHSDADTSQAITIDNSAVVLGLYHRTLMSCVRSRDVTGTLRVLARLQSLTDENKRQSLTDFFDQIRGRNLRAGIAVAKKELGPVALLSQAIQEGEFAEVQYPAMFPQIPLNVLAAMLDLFTESGEMDVARWMVHTEDVDGPLIPVQLYSNQLIAPPLIRFAAASRDSALMANVTKVQQGNVSGRTLVALCDSRIQQGDWRGAGEIFGLIRDYSLHEWSSVDFAKIIKSLLGPISGTATSLSSPAHQASTLLQRLLRGDLGQVWGTEFVELDSLVAIMCTIDPKLMNLCSNLLSSLTEFHLKFPGEAFDLILQGVVRTYGSGNGRRLWNIWCAGGHGQRNIRLDPVATSVLRRTKEFHSDEEHAARQQVESRTARIHGRIEPDLRTIRIIVQQALRELQGFDVSAPALVEQSSKPSLPTSKTTVSTKESAVRKRATVSVLQWAGKVLRTTFRLSDKDIGYELQEHLWKRQSNMQSEQVYSKRTLEVWKGLQSEGLEWTADAERRMREFARASIEGRGGDEEVFDPVIPHMRLFLHLLATDLGLESQTMESSTRSKAVRLSSAPGLRARMPLRTIAEVASPADGETE